MPAPLQQVHLQHGRIRELHEEDFCRIDFAQAIDGDVAREGMEAIQNEANRRVIHFTDDGPRLPVVGNVAPPGKRLESNPQASRTRPLPELAKVVHNPTAIVARGRRHIGAHQQQRRPKLLHQIELSFGAFEDSAALRFGHPLEVAEWLKARTREPQIADQRSYFRGGAPERQEIVLEDLDALEARVMDRTQLGIEAATDRDRCNRHQH